MRRRTRGVSTLRAQLAAATQTTHRNEDEHSTELVRIDYVLARIPIGKSLLYEMIANGEFPRPRKIGRRIAVWSRAEVDGYVDRLLKAPPSDNGNNTHTPPTT